MSVSIIFNGNRKVIKILNANTLVSNIIDDAFAAFNIELSFRQKCVLKHKRNILDQSLSWRFSNLSNNVALDLIINGTIPQNQPLTAKVNHSEETVGHITSKPTSFVKIALSVESLGSFCSSFPDSFTFADILSEFINNGSIPSCLLSSSCEIIYMRNRFTHDLFSSTSLSSLGLSGQSVRLQLRTFGNIAMVAPTQEIIHADDINTNQSSMSNLLDQQDIVPLSTHPFQSNNSDDLIESRKEDLTVALSLEDICQNICNEYTNNKIVIVNAFRILKKYVDHIIHSPEDMKFRTINAGNKVFQEKVVPAKGSKDFLLCLGFTIQDGTDTYVLDDVRLDLDILKRAQILLDKELQLLEVTSAVISSSASTPTVSKQPQSSSNPNLNPSFDPFKSTIVRTAPQPHRTTDSVTESKLEQLSKRRRELEGDPDQVARCTELLMPSAEKSVPSLQSYLQVLSDSSSSILNQITGAVEQGEEDGSNDADDRRLLNKAMIQKVKNLMSNQDNSPLTTKAIRDLQKAEKERVYNRILIRIKFPDRACLQGYFHPRHGISEVYQWTHQSLASFEDDVCEGRAASDVFELYASPPKRVFSPEGDHLLSTLQDLGLIPAAMLHLGWKRDRGLSTDGMSVAIGSYFSNDILMLSEGKASENNSQESSSSSSSSSSASRTHYPTSEKLIADHSNNINSSQGKGQQQQKQQQVNIAEGKSSASISDSSSKKISNSDGKPKWFKL